MLADKEPIRIYDATYKYEEFIWVRLTGEEMYSITKWLGLTGSSHHNTTAQKNPPMILKGKGN